MRIRLTANEAAFERSLVHIIQLYVEQPEVTYVVTDGLVGDGEPDWGEFDAVLRLHTEDSSGLVDHHAASRCLRAYGSLRIKLQDGSVRLYEAEHTRDVTAEATHEQFRKQVKNSLCHALLRVLTDWTGIEQPWGILTGVRPTKLMHDARRRGLASDAARKELKEDYLVTDQKVALMERIVERQLTALPDLDNLQKEISIYIGIPFCPTKCAYCTFPAYDINGRQGSVNSFLGGLHYEIREIGRFLKERGVRITTIYYGGGTPTSITAEEMDMLYEEMYESFPDVGNVREITVEAGRPDTITPEKLDVLRKWNIDRISINPQSYIQETLDIIGRHHSVEETIEKYKLAREMGMNNINMDLIIGLPGEGVEEFDHTLCETEKLMPESLTVHTLSFKRASEMTQHRGEEKFKVADRHEIAQMMTAASEWTDAHGYVPYYLYRQKNILGNLENVGYSIPGTESLYNILIIEEIQSILGLGCGATTKWVHPETGAISRFANPKEPKVYNDNYVEVTRKKIEMMDQLFPLYTQS
ncbi:coproporphyrinogen III oxidase [Paenibacillus sp. UMB4589-SE434]|uniref:coproporphyrinogen III oxidase n=1 Tax=Paenibacillus sp. UMB4589-SE434 TaxID=3046314 RepID=UPI00254BC899|nr:coproporphyrinogen III oxidase [Paenibacillus sp. UMB4589-SE434]MDK8181160.1 coproporphyrinogen III oxidase [Paenibacillus sp. UMB4589-SE434]